MTCRVENTQNQAVPVAPFTAFPNAFLDELMSTLKDTEWRVFCVIVRQTVGWSDEQGGRKTRDWLSQSQLIARTGRNSAALSAAIDGLIRRRLIDASDEKGTPLLTPAQRRKHRGRVYYGLCPNGDKPVDKSGEMTSSQKSPQKIPLHKANTTKETGNKRNFNKERPRSSFGDPEDRAATANSWPIRHRGWERAEEVALRASIERASIERESRRKVS